MHMLEVILKVLRTKRGLYASENNLFANVVLNFIIKHELFIIVLFKYTGCLKKVHNFV